MTESLLLKLGTVKGWGDLSDASQSILERFFADGVSASCAMDHPDDARKEILCELIDQFDGEIQNDWSGEILSKDAAKEYVRSYGTPVREALEPCPFCGSKMVAQGATAQKTISVWCMKCGTRGPDVPFPDFCEPVAQIELCHQRWNTRAAAPGEPCAWRSRSSSEPDWLYHSAKLAPHDWARKDDEFEEQPLYTTPQPAAGWDWLPVDHRPLKTGTYLVGHRGYQEIMKFFGPDIHWLPGTQMGWLRLTEKGWERDDPAERFKATHCVMIQAPGDRREAPAPAEGVEIELEPWRDELSEIVGHLGAAIVQSCAKDDQIIMDHVKAAHEIAKIVRRKA